MNIFLSLFVMGCLFPLQRVHAQTADTLIVIEQDYAEALQRAAELDRLLFVDFYTTWCAPCKELDQLVFQNDSIQGVMKDNVVLLRYDAENDSVFHLSKKHHVSSYPTGLVLNGEGYVLNRKYGFPGESSKELGREVLAFMDESVGLQAAGRTLPGYTNEISVVDYPDFYIDFVNRTDTKTDSVEMNTYMRSTEDILSEHYFSILLYFAGEMPDDIAELALANREQYVELYGTLDVDILMYFLTSGKFDRAIEETDQKKYERAVAFAKAGLDEEWTDDILPAFEKDYLEAQGKWGEVFTINEQLKEQGEFDSGYINHFCRQVYRECDDQQVIEDCLTWMKEVTAEAPTYQYLETYALLMDKSGNNSEAKKIAQLAIDAAGKDKEVKSMRKLLEK